MIARFRYFGKPDEPPLPPPPPTSPSARPVLSPYTQREKDAANEQHYEVNVAFYDLALGPRLKYSSGFWPKSDTTLEESEVAMLEMYCQRAQLEDGLKV